MVIAIFLAISFYFFWFQGEFELKLLGDEVIEIFNDEPWDDEGVIVLRNGRETNRRIQITGEVKDTVGEHIITYLFRDMEVTRKIIILDNMPPTITLLGNRRTNLSIGENFIEPGFSAYDNVDGDLTDYVVVSGEIGNTEGPYVISYTVTDSSNNVTTVFRVIARGDEIIHFDNEVTQIAFIPNGIRVFIYHEESLEALVLKDQSGREISRSALKMLNEDYYGDVLLNDLANGTYYLYISIDGQTERLINRLDEFEQIRRARMSDNLVDFFYPNEHVQIKVSNFAYQYDILIDVGHGGRDPGAVRGQFWESNLNLEVSLYEAARFEEHGLRVKINRRTNYIELEMGPTDWNLFRRRAYALGYYGVVSRIVYSNHHNAWYTDERNGPEILVLGNLTRREMRRDRTLFDKWYDFVPDLNPEQTRFYTRNFHTGEDLSKLNGEVHNIRTWFGMIRTPFELFNVSGVTIFEPAYMSNTANFEWYWLEENWKIMSEMKIRTYVEYLGLTYIPPTPS